ncbi:MAG: formylglycine-generating enzyme family protein [Hydrococcus sp. RM1_1_31]|nr:formylglycine-generating enzyme family protein [Hydrococcus sp. RM1_1_31]
MVAVRAGNFWMGAPMAEAEGYDCERPQHRVTVKPLCMGKYPITQAQWQAIAATEPINLPLEPNPAKFQGADRPIERISWFEAVEFCQRLSRLSGRRYRLPSEAQWEYACRGGTTSPFHFGKQLPQHLVNYHGWGGNGGKQEGTTTVGNFGVANAFGLYDMHGNVYEWCLDHWHDDYEGAPIDGSAWLDNQEEERVIRGGFWLSYAKHCRSAHRDSSEPDSRSSVIGFRVVCDAI